jgi:hypothetical protein
MNEADKVLMRRAFHEADEAARNGTPPGAPELWSPDHQWSAMLAAAPQAPQQAQGVTADALKRVKQNLMHQRRFGVDDLGSWRRAATQAEGDIEEALAAQAAPAPAPQALTPLADEQIDLLAFDAGGLPNSHLEFARAIERAHGIGAASAGGDAAPAPVPTRPLCRDCADFGPICPNDGKPCAGGEG